MIDVRGAAPALEAVESLPPRLYDAAFRQTNRWRGPPGTHSDAIDAAWSEIEVGAGGIRLTEAEVRALNVTVPGSEHHHPLHRIPDEHGGGYLAMLEVFHLLHCLVRHTKPPSPPLKENANAAGMKNSLRVGLWFNYDRCKHLEGGVHRENVLTHYGEIAGSLSPDES